MMVFEKQFVFIIGAPRSGTTWLQAILGSHPSVCTTVELFLFNDYTFPLTRAWKAQIRSGRNGWPEGLPTLWTEEEFYEFLREFLNRAYERVLAIKPSATILLDKHPGYSTYVEHINWLIPDAKFIHVIRDGRDVAVSLLAASSHMWGSFAPSKIEPATSMWKEYVLGAQKAQHYGNRYLEVKYEALLTDGLKTLSSIFKFIGLPVDLEEITSILGEHQFEKMKERRTAASKSIMLPESFFRKGTIGDWQNALNPVQRYIFHELAGDLLCKLGYADDLWWIDRRRQRITLPFLSFLCDWGRSRRKITQLIRRALGPVWDGRLRAVQGRLQQGARSRPTDH
jgi:hypothetical protein